MFEHVRQIYLDELAKHEPFKANQEYLELYQKSIKNFHRRTNSKADLPEKLLVNSCLAMAIKAVVGATDISPEKPFNLPNDERAAIFLWTALMIVSQFDEPKRFDHHSIRCSNSIINDQVKRQKGFLTTFSLNSVYRSAFTKPGMVDDILISQYLSRSSVEVERAEQVAFDASRRAAEEARQQSEIVRNNKRLLDMAKLSTTKAQDIQAFSRIRVDLNVCEEANGDSALILATRCGNMSVVHALLEQGADPFVKNRAGQTAKDIAPELGNPQLCSLLKGYELLYSVAHFSLTQTRTNNCLTTIESINFQNLEGSTALMIAVIKGDLQMGSALLQMRADPNIPNRKGQTAISLAEEHGMSFVLERDHYRLERRA